jgi:hypothetical protein
MAARFSAAAALALASALLPGSHAVLRAGEAQELSASFEVLPAAAANPDQQLRVCNAYVHRSSLGMTLARTGQSLGSLAFKGCSDFTLALQPGDRLEFSLEGGPSPGMEVGAFRIGEVPEASRGMLLIAQRQGKDSLRASFQSHSFAQGRDGLAQVAVMDTYVGSGGKSQRISIAQEVEVPVEGAASSAVAQAKAASLAAIQAAQEVALNSVVAISPGAYSLKLGEEDRGDQLPKLSARSKGKYVILRVGGAAYAPPGKTAEAFPEELVVFPPPGSEKEESMSMFGSLLSAASNFIWGQ